MSLLAREFLSIITPTRQRKARSVNKLGDCRSKQPYRSLLYLVRPCAHTVTIIDPRFGTAHKTIFDIRTVFALIYNTDLYYIIVGLGNIIVYHVASSMRPYCGILLRQAVITGQPAVVGLEVFNASAQAGMARHLSV